MDSICQRIEIAGRKTTHHRGERRYRKIQRGRTTLKGGVRNRSLVSTETTPGATGLNLTPRATSTTGLHGTVHEVIVCLGKVENLSNRHEFQRSAA
jgi:hypothetical protein